ncbi:hypothetical protein [Sphingomonas sp.]|uniref:hypothetical protein n=1 Tax=Sphingomonas sp. TaxID=28214 RepID=UPI0035BBB439
MSPISSEVDEQIERARASMARISADYRDSARGAIRGHSRRIRRGATTIGRRVALIAAANAVLLLAAAIVGATLFPLGIFGALAVLLMMVAVTLAIALAPVAKPPTEAKLREADIKVLPARTERWLEAQRPALPAPARTMIDRIGVRLEALSPQLAALHNASEPAFEVRRLIGEQLPAFVNDYARVPPTLRTTPRNGRTPDAELVDGLKLIEQEIGDMTQRLAQTDLDALSTRGRFLEMKYKDEA